MVLLLLLLALVEPHPAAGPVLVVVLQILVVDLLLAIRTPILLPILGWGPKDRVTGGHLEQHHLHGAGHEEESQDREANGQAHQPLHLADYHRGEQHSLPGSRIARCVCCLVLFVVRVSRCDDRVFRYSKCLSTD